MIAAHLGIVDEDQINNMSYIFFEDVLEELGHKLTYDAVVNYAGNGFCEKSWDIISENNPLNLKEKGTSGVMKSIADLFGKGKVKIKKG